MSRTGRRVPWDPRSFEAAIYDDLCHTVTCPVDTGGCGAQPQQPCANPITGRPTRVSHWQRHRAASQPEGTPAP